MSQQDIAMLPHPDLDRLVRIAAECEADVRDGVGIVMHGTKGRANPQEVHRRILALRSEFPAHLRDAECSDEQDTMAFCDRDHGATTSNVVGPKTRNLRLVTCVRCLDVAQADAEEMAAQAVARKSEIAEGKP